MTPPAAARPPITPKEREQWEAAFVSCADPRRGGLSAGGVALISERGLRLLAALQAAEALAAAANAALADPYLSRHNVPALGTLYQALAAFRQHVEAPTGDGGSS